MFKSVEVEEIFSELAWGPYIKDVHIEGGRRGWPKRTFAVCGRRGEGVFDQMRTSAFYESFGTIGQSVVVLLENCNLS